ncbi:type II secretion system protein GspD [Tichowtungia aerotolerans]|uniref:Type II/III secretion system secretin-like domain-containing protein n=1 Tax=Tichowtungia aerotolerans TaxID=2697043 RepID=A0A6P1MA75_9BACT|nr:hypothetical protein [Tichowtungia aerotolerans]QHI68025.1 hypothetical protein GT409_00685 [Tichowtungia aerotolerans]
MKRCIGELIIAGAMAGGLASAEVVIASSTGVSDESDVVLEKAVDSLREAPVDTVRAVGDTVDFAADELRNTIHGAAAPFRQNVRETVRANLLMEVEQAWNATDKIQMKTFSVKEDVAKELLAGSNPGQAKIDVRSFFKTIDFPEECAADFWPDFNRLIVRQTAAGMLQVVDVLAEHHDVTDYRQVEIETRFVEVEQKVLNELGFSWNFNEAWQVSGDWLADLPNQTLGGTLRTAASALDAGSAGSMTLTKDGWLPLDLVISALEQSGGADVLSAPSVTTQDGEMAEIWVGDQEMMPTAFQVGQKESSLYVEFDDWERQNLGVYLKVTPEVLDDGLINLDLQPEVIDLIGFDDYQITPGNAEMMVWAGRAAPDMKVQGRFPILNMPGVIDTAWNNMFSTLGGEDPNEESFTSGPKYYDQGRAVTMDEYGVPVPQLNGSLPVFRVRKLESNLTVADGSTVGMGGLIYEKLETYKDKVPVLGSIPFVGRLFRSEGERSVKRNLMIFATATQVDVNGRRSSQID